MESMNIELLIYDASGITYKCYNYLCDSIILNYFSFKQYTIYWTTKGIGLLKKNTVEMCFNNYS